MPEKEEPGLSKNLFKVRSAITILSLLFSTLAITAQVYEPLECSGEIPHDFRKDLIVEFESRASQDTIIKKSKSKISYYKSDTYFLSRLYQSGLVLFNDTISLYLEQVKNKLLKDNPELSKKIRVYTIRYSSVNAFTTSDGSIFVNLGLLARLSSEDELAFVLSHEIAHYINQHVLEGYVEDQEIEKRNKRTNDKWKIALEKCQYSRDKETEADLDGLVIFEKAGYSWEALTPIFTVLKDADLPVFEVDDSIETIENPHLKFNDSLFFDTPPLNTSTEASKDTLNLSTHPAPKLRLKILLEKSLKKKKGVSSSQQFLTIKKISQFELVQLYNENFDFYSSFYLISHLTKQYSNDPYLSYQKVRAIYGLTKLACSYRKDYCLPSINYKYNSFFYRFVDFVRNDLSNSDLLKWCYSECLNHNSNYDFKNDEIDEIINDLNNTDCGEQNELSLAIDTTFNLTIKEPTDIHSISSEQNNCLISNSGLIVLNPEFVRVNLTKSKNQFNYNFSVEKQKDFNSKVQISGKKVNSEIHILDIKTLTKNDAQKWNEITSLMKFLEERNRLKNITGFVSLYEDDIKHIMNKYHSNEILLSFGVSAKTPKTIKDIAIPLVFCFAILPIPFSIYSFLKPNEHSLFYSELVSMVDGETKFEFENHMDQKGGNGVLGANIYYVLNQIHKCK